MVLFFHSIHTFWDRYPAFFLAVFFVQAIYFWFFPSVFGITCILLSFALSFLKWKGGAIAFILGYSFAYLNCNYTVFEKLKGEGTLVIRDIQKYPTHYALQSRAIGDLKDFHSDAGTIQMSSILIYGKGLNQINGQVISVEGTLKQIEKHRYSFSIEKIKDQRDRRSLPLMRRKIKDHLKKYLIQHMRHKGASLLYGLFTGEVDNIEIKMLFSRLGLSHLLAISGFHFSFFLGIASFVFNWFKFRFSQICLIVIAIVYALLLGEIPSLKRAYWMSLFLLVGEVLGFSSSTINRLGATLLVVTLVNPYILLNEGFQLSSLATFSLILFFPLWQLCLNYWPNRSLEELKEFSWLSRIGYYFLKFFKGAFGVQLAVYTLTLPFILCRFQSFPILSLYYNLIGSIAISFLMLIGIICLLIPQMFIVSDFFSEWFLTYLEFFPRAFDWKIEVGIPIELCITVIFITSCLGIYWFESKGRGKEGVKFFI